MKNQVFILFISLLVGACDTCGQVKQLNDAPLYEIGGQSAKGLACFAERNIQDSLKVYFKVEVSLNQPLQKHVDKVIASSVQVTEMRAVNFQKTGYPEVFYLTSIDKTRDKKYQELWDKYTQYIKAWYKDLPYETMKNPEYYGLKTIKFIGVFMLIPQ